MTQHQSVSVALECYLPQAQTEIERLQAAHKAMEALQAALAGEMHSSDDSERLEKLLAEAGAALVAVGDFYHYLLSWLNAARNLPTPDRMSWLTGYNIPRMEYTALRQQQAVELMMFLQPYMGKLQTSTRNMLKQWLECIVQAQNLDLNTLAMDVSPQAFLRELHHQENGGRLLHIRRCRPTVIAELRSVLPLPDEERQHG